MVDPRAIQQRHLTAMHMSRVRAQDSENFTRGLERTGSWSSASFVAPPSRLDTGVHVPPGQDLLRSSIALGESRTGPFADPLQPFATTGNCSDSR
jgi:hypothetical protein